MKLTDPVKWRSRASFIYVAAVWGTLGSFAYLTYTGHFQDTTENTEEKESEKVRPHRLVNQTATSSSVITFRKDFVPYSTRISNFIRSFSSGPGDK